MADTKIAEWTFLHCECGGDLFLPLLKLKYKPGGGTVIEQAGHQCVACQAIVDNRYMTRLIEMNDKRRQLRELQQELGETEAAPEPGAAKPKEPVGAK